MLNEVCQGQQLVLLKRFDQRLTRGVKRGRNDTGSNESCRL
jgi:hypothetical protein